MANSASSARAKPTPTRGANTRTPKGLDFSDGVVGKYYDRAAAAQNVVILDADLIEAFPDSAAVNAALRTLKQVAERTGKGSPRRRLTAACLSLAVLLRIPR